MNINYKLRKSTETIKTKAYIFHNIYGIKNLEEFLFISLVSQYKNSDVIKIINVSINAKNGLFIVKNKKEKI